MTVLILECANILLVAMEFFIFVILTSSFFPMEKNPKRNALCLILGFAVDYAVINIFANTNTVLKLVFTCIVFVAMIRILFHPHLIICIATVLMFVSLVNVFDEVFLFGAARLYSASQAELLSSPGNYYFIAYSAKIAELFFAAIIHQWGKSRFYHRISTWRDYLRITIFPLTILICAAVMMTAFIQHPEVSSYLLICIVFMLLTDVAAIVLLNQFEDQQQKLMEAQILQQELKSSKENVELLADSYANERKMTHDFKNQLFTIQGLLENDGAQATIEYLNQLTQIKPIHSLPFTTNRAVADVILTQKCAMAKEKHIKLSYKMDDLSAMPIPDDALVVLLANLMDNAIEACEKIADESKREICLKARTGATGIVFSIENTVAEPVKIKNDYIITTKENRLRHGFGLQNIISIITKYQGDYVMDYDNGRFIFVVQFDFPEKL